MPGYPNLFPTGFVEYEKDSCEGPLLYRSQPGRETKGITELNQVVSKYGQGQYKGGDFLRLAQTLKNTSRMWERLPAEVKRQFLELLVTSDSKLSEDIIKKYIKEDNKKVKFSDTVEYFGENETVEYKDNKMSILVIVVVAIVAIVIGFLISCAAK
jgi:hypothetical protein